MVEDFTIIETITIIIATGGFVIGLITYKTEQTLKRKENLFSELEKFDKDEDLDCAKAILDDFGITVGGKTFHKSTLQDTLRDHRKVGVTHEGEIEVRESFDSLLDFFGRLEYLIQKKLLDKEKDLYHFEYYITKAAELKPICDYVRTYQFPLQGLLNEKLNKKPIEV
jgi:hypothetical protein